MSEFALPLILFLWVAVIQEWDCAFTSNPHFELMLFLSVLAPPLIFSLWVSVIPECVCASTHTLTSSFCYSWVLLLPHSHSYFELMLFLSVFAPPLILFLWIVVTPVPPLKPSLWVSVISEWFSASAHTLISKHTEPNTCTKEIAAVFTLLT